MITREQFYKSKRWETFRRFIINARTEPDGFVHCAMCGKPILKKYDMVLDHIQELDDLNVNDTAVALNPQNIQILHFKCHNEKHHRFSAGHTSTTYSAAQRRVYIVYGAPCAGKSTWVRENADPEDLVVDLDSIWEAITTAPRYTKPAALKAVVFSVRDNLYDQIRMRAGKWRDAYVITGGALAGDRERLAQRIGATHRIYIDTPQEECLERAAQRDMTPTQREEWKGYINEWFREYQPDETEEE